MGLPGGQTTGMGSGDLLHPHRDNGASHWGLSSPRKVQAGAHSAEPSLGFRVNTEMHHLYGQGEESRVSQRRERRRGGLHEAALSIQPPRHRTRLWGWFSGGFSQPCRASAAVPSTGIPHSCFLPPYLTGTSGGSAPPPHSRFLHCPPLPPPPSMLATVLTAAPKAKRSPPGSCFPSKMPTLSLTLLQPSHLPAASPGLFYCSPPPLPHPPPFSGSPVPQGGWSWTQRSPVHPPTHPDAAPHGGPTALWHTGRSRTPPPLAPPGHLYPHLGASSNHIHHPLGCTQNSAFLHPPHLHPMDLHSFFSCPLFPIAKVGGFGGGVGAGALSRVCRCGVRTWVTHRPRCHPPPTISSQGGGEGGWGGGTACPITSPIPTHVGHCGSEWGN